MPARAREAQMNPPLVWLRCCVGSTKTGSTEESELLFIRATRKLESYHKQHVSAESGADKNSFQHNSERQK